MENEIAWTVDLEVNLFHALRKHKPVGINRHFQMLIIHDKLNTSVAQRIPIQSIWEHLSTMYDLQALNDSDILPFPNKEEDFELPENDFASEVAEMFPRFKSVSVKIEPNADNSGHTTRQTSSDADASKQKSDSRQIKEEKADESKELDKKDSSREEKKEASRKGAKDSEKAGKSDETQEQRKRTRQSGQHSGAGDTVTPSPSSASASKRARRT